MSISGLPVILWDSVSLPQETFADYTIHTSLPMVEIRCPSPGYFLHPLQTSIIALNPLFCICVAVFPITLEFLRDMPSFIKSVISGSCTHKIGTQ